MIIARFLYQNQVYMGKVLSSGTRIVVYCPDLGKALALEDLTLLPPCQPTKIIGIGPNYKDTSSDFPAEPSYFFKPPSSLCGVGAKIMLPPEAKDVAFEPELAVVVGQRASKIGVAEASRYIAGYTCANDVTAVDLLEVNFNKGKSYDTFTPVGPWLVTDFQPGNQGIYGCLNGKQVIASTIANLYRSAAYLLSYLSGIMTLEAGDLILTGASSRFSPIKNGDTVTVKVEGIGELTNSVKFSKI